VALDWDHISRSVVAAAKENGGWEAKKPPTASVAQVGEHMAHAKLI
jgi:hypothetical protein